MDNNESAQDTFMSIVTSDTRSKIINDELTDIFFLVNFGIICGVISFFGIIANIINVIIFYRQGFKDTVNISFFTLAVSDLLSLIGLLWLSLCFFAPFRFADLPFMPTDVQYLTGGWPHVIFARITGWVTAFVTVERCLCIAMPLKVKNIITRSRVGIVICVIVFFVVGSAAPAYYTSRFDLVYFPKLNKTLVGLVFTSDRGQVEEVSFAINSVFCPLGSFTAVVISTVVLVVKLNEKTKWRQNSVADNTKNASIAIKEQKVIKMVVGISTIFIVSFTPAAICFSAMALEPEFRVTGFLRQHQQRRHVRLVYAGGHQRKPQHLRLLQDEH
ncbi:QRFP-like peptide receptor [Physella acuta]|uniref:QRFP-like peptide receptor n=1 Tax=Physella acuta TaxID=109671 RepID=UPI0027DE6D82|nr:QRFP-like peptide receptor [Physella acuta]